MLIATIAYLGLCALSALMTIAAVGKPRKPITGSAAVGFTIGTALTIAYVLWLYSAAARR